MKRFIRYTMAFAACLCAGSVTAQSTAPQVNARFTADTVLIGDQFHLEVDVEKDMAQIVAFPDFAEGRLVGPIEILSESLDTLQRDGRSVTLRQSYLLTVFDEGRYGLGHFPVLYIDKNITDTIPSIDSLFIVVQTLPVDTLTQTIVDIRPPVETPFVLAELKEKAPWIALVLVIIAGVVWLVLRRRNHLPVFSRSKSVDPPHVAAIKELERIYAEKLWQNNRHKQYYTRITDTVRLYIEDRFGINAMEQTSDEILQSFDRAGVLADKDRQKLSELFSVSDMVKFAKYVPLGDENEMAYNNAYYFVEDTKFVPQEGAEKTDMEGGEKR